MDMDNDLSNWEPDYEKIKRIRDREFEDSWRREILAKSAAERKQGRTHRFFRSSLQYFVS
jgi:hypothetical protein